MVTVSYVVQTEQGLHARPVALIGAEARHWQSELTLTCRGRRASALDLIELMMLDARKGDTVELTATGSDEQAAARAISALFTF